MRRRPQRIILVRHGQSEGNVDESAYTCIPDSKIALTEVGWKQAVLCGKKIRKIIESDNVDDWQVYFYVSPYRRTLQTLRGMGMAFERERIAGVREEPRLREQDFGGLLFFWPCSVLLLSFLSSSFFHGNTNAGGLWWVYRKLPKQGENAVAESCSHSLWSFLLPLPKWWISCRCLWPHNRQVLVPAFPQWFPVATQLICFGD